jgi:hypothetical protein
LLLTPSTPPLNAELASSIRIGRCAARAAARLPDTEFSCLVTVSGAISLAIVASGPELYWCTVSKESFERSSAASEDAQDEDVPAVSGPAIRLLPTAAAHACQSAW